MKIRDKLLLGFGLYIFLAGIFGFFALRGIRAIETKLLLVEAADDVTNTMLEVRRYEKNFLLYGDKKDYLELKTYLSALKENIDNIKIEIMAEMGRENFEMMKRSVAEYERLIDAVASGRKTESTINLMRQTAREVQHFTQNLSKKERANIAATIRLSTDFFLLALLVILIIGAAVNIKLATSIAAPLRELERITKKISRGDFSESIEVKGKDEIASLASSFNYMEQKLDHAMASLEDIIHKLHEKQAQLVEAEKLAAVGKLAAGIAHEINNPLTAVLTFSNLMLEQCPKDGPYCDKLRLIARETERARNIVRQLLNFGKEIVIRPEWIEINQPVYEIIESLQAQDAFKGIALTLDLAEGLPKVYADPAQIGQVVLNITLNAIHSITPPGRIEIVTRSSERYVEIVFSDSGSGIPEEHIHKIFDPFFTTKDFMKGTGLGLAVSYGIVKKHGGDIGVMSTVGKGTTFIVRLPING